MAELRLPDNAEPRDNRRYDEATDSMYHVSSYLSDPDIVSNLIKEITDPQRQNLLGIGGAGVNYFTDKETIIEQFEYIQHIYKIDSRGGKRAYHELLVFDDEEIKAYGLTADDLINIGKDCSNVYYLLGFQAVYAVHWDKKYHFHIDFVVNSVSFKTGGKWNPSRKSFNCRSKYFDSIVKEYESLKANMMPCPVR